jgi:hypothetical protein
MSETFPIPFGRYQLLERLAVGGMAELFKARVVGAHGFQKPVVIKKILPHLAADASFVAMFIDEAKITARLDHPKIAQVLELGTIDEQMYIAMEFVDGPDVLALLRSCAHRKQVLPVHIGVHIAAEVLDALEYAHHARDEDGTALSIVHRDISPSNVLISRRGDVKLADFGIAHAVERQQKTQAGTLKGKYGYMSPEQVVGGDLDGRSDLFSVGIVLAEMLMGRRLFTAPNELDVLLMVRDVKLDRLDKYGAAIPEDLRAILLRALQRDAKDRFVSAAAFRDALIEWLFAHRLRVGPSDLAALVDALTAGVQKTPVPGPLPVASAGSSSGGGAAVVAPPATGTLAGPNTKAKILQAEEAARLGRAAAEKLAASGAAPAVPASSAPGPAGASRNVVPRAVVVPTKRPLEDVILDLGETDADQGQAVARLSSEGDSGPVVMIEHGEPSGRALAASANTASSPSQAFGHTPKPGQELDFADLSLELDLAPAPPAKKKPTPSQMVESVKKGSAPPTNQRRVGVVGERADQEGDFAVTSPIHVLYKLAVDKSDGLLVVEISAITKEIYLAGGTPEFVSSNVARELLGEYLVGQKVISAGELAMALAMMPHFGGKLGDTLVGLGLLKPLDVFRHLTRQVRDKIIDVCTWQKGHYRWYRGRRNLREAFPLGLDAFEVLGAGASHMSAQSIEAWLTANGHRVATASKNPRVVPEAFRLGGYPRDVYDRLDGRVVLRDFAARFTDQDERLAFLRTLYLLVQTELAFLD